MHLLTAKQVILVYKEWQVQKIDLPKKVNDTFEIIHNKIRLVVKKTAFKATYPRDEYLYDCYTEI